VHAVQVAAARGGEEPADGRAAAGQLQGQDNWTLEIPRQVNISYLCTYDLYGPIRTTKRA
jgi:hypothetical protein